MTTAERFEQMKAIIEDGDEDACEIARVEIVNVGLDARISFLNSSSRTCCGI